MEFAVTALRADDSCRSTACRSPALIGVAMVLPRSRDLRTPIRAHGRASGRMLALGAAVRPAPHALTHPRSISTRVDNDLRLDARCPVARIGASRHAALAVVPPIDRPSGYQ